MTECPCCGLLANCPLCGGSGKLAYCICGGLRHVAEKGAGGWTAVPCPRCGEEEVVGLELPAGLSGEQQGWTFGSVYQDEPVLAEVAARLEGWARVERQGWYVFAAPWGRGKTYLMACLVNCYRQSGREAMYWVTSEMLAELQDAQLDRSSSWAFGALYRALVEVPLLCLDEFGHVGLTTRRGEWLRAILVSRSDGNWRPTVFATNAVPEQFNTEMPWLWSRWRDSHCQVERFEGIPDLRGRREAVTL